MNLYMMKYKIWDLLQDFSDFVNYDLIKKSPPDLPNFKLDLQFKEHRKNGLIWVESIDYPGLIASGRSKVELREAVFDAILTYFDVPRYRAKRLPDLLRLTLGDGTVMLPPERIPLIQVHTVAA